VPVLGLDVRSTHAQPEYIWEMTLMVTNCVIALVQRTARDAGLLEHCAQRGMWFRYRDGCWAAWTLTSNAGAPGFYKIGGSGHQRRSHNAPQGLFDPRYMRDGHRWVCRPAAGFTTATRTPPCSASVLSEAGQVRRLKTTRFGQSLLPMKKARALFHARALLIFQVCSVYPTAVDMLAGHGTFAKAPPRRGMAEFQAN